jgi:uncharacterized protein with HEPN domain
MAGQSRDIDHLELIIDLIGMIDRRLEGQVREDFLVDRDEADLTAFRLGHIGEATGKLSSEIRARHAEIRWGSISGMRNILVHNYGAIIPQLLWKVSTEDLDLLREVCRSELERLAP